MKKQLILSCLLGMTSICAIAQLEVDSLGNVGIRRTPSDAQTLYVYGSGQTNAISVHGGTSSGIRIDNHGSKGIHIRTSNEENSASYGLYVRPSTTHTTNMNSYGISAIAGYSTAQNVGVWGGFKSNATYGAGVVGTSGESINLSSYLGLYAGFFRGDVRVVDGVLNGNLLTPAANSSAAVADMSILASTAMESGESESVADKLSQVSLLQYYREPFANASVKEKQIKTASKAEKEDVEILFEEDDDEEEEDDFVPQTQLARVQYGLAADQLKAVYPELVYEDKTGNVSINYIELIPLLVQANNELRARVAALEAEKEMMVQQPKNMMAATLSLPIGKETGEGILLSLGQNNPNPFSEQTSIEVSVPEAVATATLLIFDMQGKQVRKIDIDERGIFRITVTDQGLTEGMYLYSLVADGKVVQTRKMILSK